MEPMRNQSAPSSDDARVEVTARPADALSADELEEWRELEAAEVSANPFLVPEWVLTWYRCFVPKPSDRLVLLVRVRATGELIGLAPMYEQTLRVGPLKVARRLVPVGSGTPTPYELPGHLAAAGQHRDVARAIVEATTRTDGADWSGLCTSPEQSWFEPEYVQSGPGGPQQTVDFWQHVVSRACVIMRLGGSWEQTRSGLKRNLKESLRRSRNRLEKSGVPYQVHRRTGAELDEQVVTRLLDLHLDRSTTDRGSIVHGNYYSDPASQELVKQALPRLAARDRATIYELELDGRIVAAQLALHARGSSYIHSSGFLPETWSYGPVTHLVGLVVQEAADRGESLVNFSPGPQVSKLRWSEEVLAWQEFGYAIGTKATLMRYLVLRALGSLRPDAARIFVHDRPPAR